MDKYNDCIKKEFPLIREWFRSGLGESEIIRRLNISASTVRRYRKTYPEFAALWQECRAERDDLVESALFKRAVGYETADGEHRKHVPPDVKAAVFWLKNRRPGRWQERICAAAAPQLQITLLAEEKGL